MMSSDKPLTEQFPVSCGTKHHEKEQESATVGQIIPDVDGSAQQTQHVFMPPQNQQVPVQTKACFFGLAMTFVFRALNI